MRASLLNLRKPPHQPADVLTDEIRGSPYAKEAEKAIDWMTAVYYYCQLPLQMMKAKENPNTIGLTGGAMERLYVRKGDNAESVTFVHMAVSLKLLKELKKSFPDDPVYVDCDVSQMLNDEDFARNVYEGLQTAGLDEDDSLDDLLGYLRHATRQFDGEPPNRYWAFRPVDNTEEFIARKQYCTQLVLMEGGEPVCSAILAPNLSFHHPSRIQESTLGCALFFAVKGAGAYTQHLQTTKNYRFDSECGKAHLKGKAMRLQASDKIKPPPDGLFEFLKTEQIHVITCTNMRQDIFEDAQRTLENLGSNYPKLQQQNACLKYCQLARGQCDTVWVFNRGLYDKNPGVEPLLDHAAGCLIAAESGAYVCDFEDKPIDWSSMTMVNNRGLMATDGSKLPRPAVMNAFAESRKVSEVLREEFLQREAELIAKMKNMFAKMGENAETPDDARAARMCQDNFKKHSEDAKYRQQMTQDDNNRAGPPLLGEAAPPPQDFQGTGSMSPIST